MSFWGYSRHTQNAPKESSFAYKAFQGISELLGDWGGGGPSGPSALGSANSEAGPDCCQKADLVWWERIELVLPWSFCSLYCLHYGFKIIIIIVVGSLLYPNALGTLGKSPTLGAEQIF